MWRQRQRCVAREVGRLFLIEWRLLVRKEKHSRAINGCVQRCIEGRRARLQNMQLLEEEVELIKKERARLSLVSRHAVAEAECDLREAQSMEEQVEAAAAPINDVVTNLA